MPTTIRGEEILGQRCEITFQISPQVRQTRPGCVTKCEASLGKNTGTASGGAAGRTILYRQFVVFDSGGELWLDLEREDTEGRLHWLPDLPSPGAEDGVPEELEAANEEPPNKKQKKDDQDTAAGNALMESLCINSESLKDVLPTIVAFLDPGDRSPMALANSNLRDAVEIHSKKMLAKIAKEHMVDDTFQDRIRDQTRIRTTTRSKPVHLPDRYLLEAAKKTRLYTLVPPTAVSARYAWAFTLNPSKTCIAFARVPPDPENRGFYVEIYDLATKRLVRHFNCQLDRQDYDSIIGIDYFENLVLVSTEMTIQVFTDAGELLRQCRDIGVIFYSSRHERIVFLDVMDGIYSFDIHSGLTKKILAYDAGDGGAKILKVVCGGRWLVARAGDVGIHVYDLKNECSLNHFLEETYDTLAQCTENPSIFYALSARLELHVLELSCEGKFTCLSSFSSTDCRGFRLDTCGQRRCFFKRGSVVREVNSMNGKIERNFVFSGHNVKSIVPNGTEVLMGLTTHDGMAVVDAFLSDNLI